MKLIPNRAIPLVRILASMGQSLIHRLTCGSSHRCAEKLTTLRTGATASWTHRESAIGKSLLIFKLKNRVTSSHMVTS